MEQTILNDHFLFSEIGDGTNTGGMVTPTGSAFQMMIILVTFYLCCILD